MLKLLFAHIFKDMCGACILFYLVLLKDNRKLSDSNTLANLLKLYKVKNERGRSRKIRPSRTIKLLTAQGGLVLKLYKFSDSKKEYWETWDNDDGSHTVHWGELGTTGESKNVKNSLFKKAEKVIQKEIDNKVSDGFSPSDDEYILLVEYAVDGFGTSEDLDKRNRLIDRLNETLGWTGLGHCDGGSIGSGTMEVCNYVVDFEVAKRVIEADLKGTEFENYTRIYDEEAE